MSLPLGASLVAVGVVWGISLSAGVVALCVTAYISEQEAEQDEEEV